MRILFLLLTLILPVAQGQEAVHPAASAAASAPAVVPAPSLPGIRVFRDLPYVPGASVRQRLDLYLPEQPGRARPLIVSIHGGGWVSGSKSPRKPTAFIQLGFAYASIDYRFSKDAVFPAQIQDCKAAIRWLRAHAGEYGIDPGRIGVWGSSAGGHLVALLGVTGQVHDFDTGPNLDQSSAVQCVVDLYGPSDFLNPGQGPGKSRPGMISVVNLLLGGPVEAHQALARLASPVYFVTKEAPPFLILHGDQDPIVPLQQSQELNAALQKAGVESTLHVVPGAVHADPAFFKPENENLIRDFLVSHLKPQQ